MKQRTYYETQLIVALLETHHRAAATKNVELLKRCFISEGYFIGTDDSEQWLRDEYVQQLAATESGWDMTKCLERHIYAVPGCQDASSFFEVVRHEKYGLMRGSGVVTKKANDWFIVQYVLSFSVPNNVVDTNLLESLARVESPTSEDISAMCEVPS